jgi:hypothetical protein
VNRHDARAATRPLPWDDSHRVALLLSRLAPAAAESAHATYALYAFCREADDAIDGGADPFIALSAFQSRLAAVYSRCRTARWTGRWRAWCATTPCRGSCSRRLLQGFAWDAQSRSYKDLRGRALLLRARSRVRGNRDGAAYGGSRPDLLARAADLGVAMQLTNIARDVGEDARAGASTCRCAGCARPGSVPAECWQEPRFTPELGQWSRACWMPPSSLYRAPTAASPRLPARCRPGIYAARRLYAGIGHELLRAVATACRSARWFPTCASWACWGAVCLVPPRCVNGALERRAPAAGALPDPRGRRACPPKYRKNSDVRPWQGRRVGARSCSSRCRAGC